MTRPRQVRGLKKAELMPSGPFVNAPKPKGSAARGLAFQRKVHKELQLSLGTQGSLLDGPWIRYADTYGQHWCQPDSVLETDDRLIVVESKLSLRRLKAALAQLQKLYRPTLELIFAKPAVMCVAFHHYVAEADDKLPMVDDPAELLSVPIRHFPGPYGWHFL